MAKKLGCKKEMIGQTIVDVANGSSVSCEWVCKQFAWKLQGMEFVTDVLLLPLGNCDMVMGIQWLETLGEIRWDFKELKMEFTLHGKRHVLRGSVSKGVELKTTSEKHLSKLLSSNSECSMI